MNFEMPRPGEEHQRLAQLAGSWRGEETMAAGPMGPAKTSTGHTQARMSPDGFYFLADYHQEVGGKRTFHGHSVIGYDMAGKRYLWYWVDSMGMPPAAATAGRFEGTDLVFENDTPHGRTRYVYALKGADRYVFSIDVSGDGGKTWSAFMQGDYRRVV